MLKQLLADKRSENTRRAYERDVNDFLKTMTGKPACPDNVLEFLHLEERQAVSVVLKYKAKLIDKGLNPLLSLWENKSKSQIFNCR